MHARHDSPYLITPAAKSHAALRLYCLPYAGGTAATYLPWSEHIHPCVELVATQLPGRANRMREQAHENIDDLVNEMATAIAPGLDKPYALFGHSLGSRLALALARELERRGHAAPVLFIASGSRAPHRCGEPNNYHELPHAEFIDKLRELNGTPEEILADKDLMELALPILRADFKLADAAIAAPCERALPCPVWVFAGERDRYQTREELLAWGDYFSQAAQLVVFPGGHFFIEQHRHAVLERMNAILHEHVGALRSANVPGAYAPSSIAQRRYGSPACD